ncbi:MAG: PKD domain-containing protein [Patiriisocius sp.]|uniref:PKD domain-containing protein n=1 Tax=Patiriisocius sp. TaxID=2822396 RepID=UPI003EF746E5
MSANKNFTNHLDRSVLLLFLGFFLVSAGTVTYKYVNRASCNEVLFSMDAKEYRVGEMIKLTDNSPNSSQWEWDFGDSSEISTVKSPLHIFDREGEYKVKLKINDLCERVETVVIKERLKLLDSTKFPIFELPSEIRVGKTLNVKDETDNATTWEWRFGEGSTIDAKTKRATYVFEEPGIKTVSLVVNGDLEYVTKKRIEVLPLPGQKTGVADIAEIERDRPSRIKNAPTSEPIKDAPTTATIKDAPTTSDKPSAAPYISEKEFSRKVLLVSNETLTAKSFSDFFCGDINKPIIVNGDNTTFLVFCEDIKGKKVKLKSLEIFRNKGSNCITNITVEYKKSWF